MIRVSEYNLMSSKRQDTLSKLVHGTMNDSLKHLLGNLPLTAEQADQLAAQLLHPPQGTILPGEWEHASDGLLALLVAIVAATHRERYREVLEPCLNRTAEDLPNLTLYNQGRYFHLRGYVDWRKDAEPYKAMHHLHRSIQLLTQSIDEQAPLYLPRVHNTYGDLLQRFGLLQDAQEEFAASLRYVVAFEDEEGQARAMGNQANLCMAQGRYEEAMEFFEADLAILERIAPERLDWQAQLLSQLGRCALFLDQTERAETYYHRSLTLAQAENEPTNLAYATLGLVAIAKRRDQLDKAETLMDEAQFIMDEGDFPHRLRTTLRGLGYQQRAELLQAKNELSGSLAFFREAQRCLNKSSIVAPVERASLKASMAEVLSELGHRNQAAQTLREAIALLEPTSTESLRDRLEQRLQEMSHESWLLHSAGRFVGQKHIEFLLQETGRQGFRGEKLHDVVVLFADIRGFSHISQQLSPEDLIAFLNSLLTTLTRCIDAFDGYVDNFIGDAIMAVFSLPRPQPWDADRAVRASLLMCTEMERFRRRQPAHLATTHLGIGLCEGDLVAGLIGSPQKRSYTVIGDAVNTASRLEGMTKQLGAQILIENNVVQKLQNPDDYLLRPLGRYIPKGQARTVEVYDVMGFHDGSPDALRMAEEIEHISKALSLLQQRKWKPAQEMLLGLVESAQESKRVTGYQKLLESAIMLSQEEPPSDWDGSLILKEK